MAEPTPPNVTYIASTLTFPSIMNESHHNIYKLLASAPAARFIFVPAVVFNWTGE